MNLRIITLVGIIIFICLISPSLYGESLTELFRDVPSFFLSQNIRNQAKQTKAVIRSRYVEVKFDGLAGKDLPQGVDRIILNLFDDLYSPAIKDRLERRSEHSYTWFGHIEGRNYSHVILTVEDNAMAGSIMFESKTYRIQDLSNGIHAIYEIDPSVFPEDAPPIVPPEEASDVSADVPPTPNADDGSTIDVMVVYTQDAANATPSIALDIQLAIDQTNQSYANSNINQRVRLVHTEQVIYSETSDFLTTLERLTDPYDGYIDEVHSLRNAYGADLSMLIVENLTDDPCGISYGMSADWISSAFEIAAFSVVRLDCLTFFSAAHEMGHNMGAQHDRYVCEEDDTGAYDYSYGYVDTPNRWRTIMAYNNECDDSGLYCVRIPYWSNPYVNYNGVPTGVSEYEIDSANNAQTLNNTAYIVANFRQSSSATTTTTTTPTSNVVITNHMMTKDPLPDTGCQTPEPTGVFYHYDEVVHCWFFYDNATVGDGLRIEWYKPNGELYTESSVTYGYETGCWYPGIYIDGFEPAYTSGNWRVDVYFEGDNHFTEFFTIEGLSTTSTTSLSTTTTQPLSDTFSISGFVFGDIKSSVSIILSGDDSKTVITDSEGYYEFNDLPTGDYWITPEKERYSFEPESHKTQNLIIDRSGINFKSTFSDKTPFCMLETIYGTDSTETELLRSIRDNVLSQTQEGQELIKLYYQWSPVIVRGMEEDEKFKQEVKDMIDSILPMIGGEQ